jgi:hypothetical protein
MIPSRRKYQSLKSVRKVIQQVFWLRGCWMWWWKTEKNLGDGEHGHFYKDIDDLTFIH